MQENDRRERGCNAGCAAIAEGSFLLLGGLWEEEGEQALWKVKENAAKLMHLQVAGIDGQPVGRSDLPFAKPELATGRQLHSSRWYK